LLVGVADIPEPICSRTLPHNLFRSPNRLTQRKLRVSIK
jgi:hypothetical protein